MASNGLKVEGSRSFTQMTCPMPVEEVDKSNVKVTYAGVSAIVSKDAHPGDIVTALVESAKGPELIKGQRVQN